MCYSEHYLEDTSQQVDSCTAAWMNCLQVCIKLNFGQQTANVWQMEVLILKFALDNVAWTVLCNAYIRVHGMSCSEGDTILYSSFPKSIFVPSHKNRLNSKLLIFSPSETLTSFEFTEVRICMDCIRIQVHIFILLSMFEELHRKSIGIKIRFHPLT